MKKLMRIGMLALAASIVSLSSCQKVESYQAEVTNDYTATVTIRIGMDNSAKLNAGDALPGLNREVRLFFRTPYSELNLSGSGDYTHQVTVSGSKATVQLPVSMLGNTDYSIEVEDFYAEYEEASDKKVKVLYRGQVKNSSLLNGLFPGERVSIALVFKANTSDKEDIVK